MGNNTLYRGDVINYTTIGGQKIRIRWVEELPVFTTERKIKLEKKLKNKTGFSKFINKHNL